MNLKSSTTIQFSNDNYKRFQFLNNKIINGSWGVRLTLNCSTVINSNFPKGIPIFLIWVSPPLFQQNNSSPSFLACKLLNVTGFLTSCSLTCTTPDTSGVKGLGPSAFLDAIFLLALILSVS